jgi:hypothetical protein
MLNFIIRLLFKRKAIKESIVHCVSYIKVIVIYVFYRKNLDIVWILVVLMLGKMFHVQKPGLNG